LSQQGLGNHELSSEIPDKPGFCAIKPQKTFQIGSMAEGQHAARTHKTARKEELLIQKEDLRKWTAKVKFQLDFSAGIFRALL